MQWERTSLTGRFSHSIRFGYVKSQDLFEDATSQQGVFNPLPDCLAKFRPGYFTPAPIRMNRRGFTRPNKQIKYDGSWGVSSHIIRYGLMLFTDPGPRQFRFAANGPILKSQITEDSIDSQGQVVPGTITIADAGPSPAVGTTL